VPDGQKGSLHPGASVRHFLIFEGRHNYNNEWEF